MKKSIAKVAAAVLLSGLFVSSSVFASLEKDNVSVSMIDPHKLGDIELSNTNLKRSAKIIQKDMVKLLQQVSKNYLKDGTKISITINRLDLPGYMDWNLGNANSIRIIRQHDFIKIKFDYEVTDSQGRTISSGSETLKDFYEPPTRPIKIKNAGSAEYFRDLFDKWMEGKFAAK